MHYFSGIALYLQVQTAPHWVQDPKKRADANTILQHDWMRENGTASERPLDNVILKRMRGFAAMNKLKKEALKVIAAGMSQEEIAGLRTMFQVTPTHLHTPCHSLQCCQISVRFQNCRSCQCCCKGCQCRSIAGDSAAEHRHAAWQVQHALA